MSLRHTASMLLTAACVLAASACTAELPAQAPGGQPATPAPTSHQQPSGADAAPLVSRPPSTESTPQASRPSTTSTPTPSASPTSTQPTQPKLPPVELIDAAPFQGAEAGTYAFVSPSGNLHCSIDTFQAEPAVGCQSVDPVANMDDCPASPVVVFSPGRPVATGCTDEKPFHAEDVTVLEYGQGFRVESLTCESRSSGVTCRDRHGAGFTAARAGFVELLAPTD